MRVIASESMRGLWAYFGSLVHDSVRCDPVATARQQAFIASHILAGVLALCVFPIYLALVGRPSLAGTLAFLWFLMPIGIGAFVSRTGRLAEAHLLSAASFAGLIIFGAWFTGGIHSFLLPWMVVVPAEAALSGERKTVAWASGLAAAGVAALGLAQGLGYLPMATALPLPSLLLAVLVVIAAVGYAAGLSLSIQFVHGCAEGAASNGEARYRLLADNATDLITRHDENGRVIYASPAAQHLLGERPGSLLGNGLFERVHVGDRPAYLTALSRCQAYHEAMSVEFRARRSGAGEARYTWLELRCTPAHDEHTPGGQGRRGVVAVTRDISQHKLVEAELARSRDAAENESCAKSQFLANMSHELRTPLNAVIGFSEILNRELFGKLGEERYRDYARLIHESGEHLLNVVNDVLDMSRIEAGKFKIVKEPFEVGPLLTLCSEIMSPAAEKRSLTLSIDVAPGLPELLADKRACKQMLLNILSNAIKFSNPGGSVRASVRAVRGAVEFSVADDGIGISEMDLPKLGNPFVQADSSYDRNYEGAGLGLSVVKGLAQLHGGTMCIESKLGGGTTVTIRLPFDVRGIGQPRQIRRPEATAA